MTERTTRITVLSQGFFGEAKTLAEWQEWLRDQFDQVPPEYLRIARLEIESVGGYEGEHHTETTVYYDRPETDIERQARHAHEHGMIRQCEKIAALQLDEANRRRQRIADESG